MANLRKLVAAALSSSNLAVSDISETAIDRIAAMAFADPLGSALWRLRLGHNPQAFRQAHLILASRARRICPSLPLRLKLCETVLHEWLDQNCRTCGGRGYKPDAHGVKGLCPTCEGSRVRRYSDVWRMGQMGWNLATYRKWERRFATLHERIAEADAEVYVEIARQLERIAPHSGAKVLEFHRKARRIAAAVRDGPAPNITNMPELLVASATGA